MRGPTFHSLARSTAGSSVYIVINGNFGSSHTAWTVELGSRVGHPRNTFHNGLAQRLG
jgi:hypothetical protein